MESFSTHEPPTGWNLPSLIFSLTRSKSGGYSYANVSEMHLTQSNRTSSYLLEPLVLLCLAASKPVLWEAVHKVNLGRP